MASDSDSPEKPNNHNDRPKDMKELFERRSQRSKPPPRHFFEAEEEFSPGQTPITEKEQRFRAAAIKLAGLEDEISELMENLPETAFREIEHLHFYKNRPNSMQFISYAEDMPGVEDKPALVEFRNRLAGHEELGLDTKTLKIGLHTDKPTFKAFELYAEKNPGYARNATTYYYFTRDGDYKKVSGIPSDLSVEPGRVPLRAYEGTVVHHYLSEMTPGDFEIAGRALAMIKQRLTTRLTELSSQQY